MSFERDIILGFGNDIADNLAARVPLWIDVDKDGNDVPSAPSTGEVGIYLDEWPEDVPAVVIADYPVSDDYALSDSTVGVQVTVWHHDRLKLRDILADVFDTMNGRWAGTMGNVRVITVSRRSGANLGQDNTGRVGRSENYYIQAHRPSGHRQ